MSGTDRAAGRALGRWASLALLLPLGACSWFTDFKDQPSVEPWESYAIVGLDSAALDTLPFVGQPMGSVPTTGERVPAWQVSYARLPATVDSMSGLVNPTAPDSASLDRGWKQYQINCAVCHGVAGEGNGPATLYGMPQLSVVNARVQGLTDGYLYGMIRNGRGLMPSYNRIEDLERWDVVNYIRGLQGRYAVRTGPAGQPGETGRTLPGASETAPQRPSPWFNPHRPGGVAQPRPAGEGAAAGTPAAPAGPATDSTAQPRPQP